MMTRPPSRIDRTAFAEQESCRLSEQGIRRTARKWRRRLRQLPPGPATLSGPFPALSLSRYLRSSSFVEDRMSESILSKYVARASLNLALSHSGFAFSRNSSTQANSCSDFSPRADRKDSFLY